MFLAMRKLVALSTPSDSIESCHGGDNDTVEATRSSDRAACNVLCILCGYSGPVGQFDKYVNK